jgi:hypothetical protein
MSGKTRLFCRFFNTPLGCKEGRNCKFRHDISGYASKSSRGIESRTVNRSRSCASSNAPSQHFHTLLHDLACWMGCELPIHKCQQWIQLALQHSSQGYAAKVVHLLKEADGRMFLEAVGQQAPSTVRHQHTYIRHENSSDESVLALRTLTCALCYLNQICRMATRLLHSATKKGKL